MLKESKYCGHARKKHFRKELVMTKEDKNVERFTKYYICDNTFLEGEVKARDLSHTTGKYWGDAHRDCNNNIS